MSAPESIDPRMENTNVKLDYLSSSKSLWRQMIPGLSDRSFKWGSGTYELGRILDKYCGDDRDNVEISGEDKGLVYTGSPVAVLEYEGNEDVGALYIEVDENSARGKGIVLPPGFALEDARTALEDGKDGVESFRGL